MSETIRHLRLVLGDQLNPEHPWFQTPDPEVLIVMMEVRQETDYVLHHAQKIIAIFAGMRRLAQQLAARRHQVRYFKISDCANQHNIAANLQQLCQQYRIEKFSYQLPDEWRLDQQLQQIAADFEKAGIQTSADDSAHFLSARDDAQRLFSQRQRWLMETFYRQMRAKHQVLMDGNQPAGGQWNFDHDNREAWRGTPAEPQDRRPVHDHRLLWEEIQAAGVKSFGEPSAQRFRWPLDREEALQQLNFFIHEVLPHFGQFQDAMHSAAPRLFHSLLSFALNVKMLHPLEVVRAAEDAWQRGAVPIASAEGFIRQILGWREYVRGIYWAAMPGYAQQNALQHAQSLPPWFWNGQTGMRCLSQSIQASLQHAHAHHIQRLMVIGNFALLAGLDPQELHQWYLGIYIDAFEWVELPNTLGMSQFADGGLLATKPYVSTSAYIHKMSDYCKGCAYDRKQKTGEKACPFNAMYWDFFLRHREQFARNPRLGMIYPQLAKMKDEDKTALQLRAAWCRSNLDQL